MAQGLRICDLFPPLPGTVLAWRRRLPRIAAMDLNCVFANPLLCRTETADVGHAAPTRLRGIALPPSGLGIAEDETFAARALLTGTERRWRGPVRRVRLDPVANPAASFRIER